jgi:hypothetical protein
MKCPECGDSIYTEVYEDNEVTTGGFDQMWRCFNCGHHWSVHIDMSIEEYYADDETADVELPPELREHTGFYIQTESGNVGHILGDPNMSEKTRKAFMELIDLAHRAVENGEIKPEDDDAQADD